MSSSSSSSSSAASSSSMFKKKQNKNKNLRSTSTLEGNATDEKSDSSSPSSSSSSSSSGTDELTSVRLLQQVRHQHKQLATTAGVDANHTADDSAAAAAADDANQTHLNDDGTISVGPDFQTEKVHEKHVDQQMEKFIREKLEERRQQQLAEIAAKKGPAPNESSSSSKSEQQQQQQQEQSHLNEAVLYQTPANLRWVNANQRLAGEAESGDRWLTGISEMSLPISVKLDNFERTEKAKRAHADAQAGKGRKKEHLPYNYNSNFKQHKEDWDRKHHKRHFDDAGGGGGGDRGPRASDDAVVGRFVKKFKERNFR